MKTWSDERNEAKWIVEAVAANAIKEIRSITEGYANHKKRAKEIEDEHAEIFDIINASNAKIDALNKGLIDVQVAYTKMMTGQSDARYLMEAIKTMWPEKAQSFAEEIGLDVSVPERTAETPAQPEDPA